ncbi:MAG TPA: twin-arginine translocation signal domain-containing protein [Acidimicrobiia bacterium]|nr:twin-arginine translocation signal domain-containing protein [Acidimicrobiia bacterium]
MQRKSRRDFLKQSGAAAAVAGIAIAVPKTAAGALNEGATTGHPSLPADARLDVPVVAHVRDLKKGVVVVYAGERELTVRDKRLAALLYHATR